MRPKPAPALSEAEHRLRSVISKAPVVLFATDANGIVTLCEGKALQKLGKVPGQSVGQSLFQMYAKYPALIASVRRALSGEDFSSSEELSELGLFFETHWTPIHDEYGRPAGTIAVAVDVSERTRNERAREDAEILYRSLVEQLSAVTYIAELGVEGEWLFVSPQIESLLGYSAAEWRANAANWIENVHPEDRHIALAAEDATQAGDPFRAEYRMLRRDGKVIWINDSGSLVPGPNGRQLLHGVLLDVTEQKQLQAHLSHSQRMEAVGQLASGVAHDFNNLLTIIKGYSSLMIDRNPGGPDSHAAREIQQAAERAAALTHQLLAFSRKQTLQPRVLDLNNIVHGLEMMLRRVLTENVELCIQTAADLGFVKTDPVQMEQVLINLVVNARDAMPKGGKLTIATAPREVLNDCGEGESLMRAGSYVTLSISDTGIGMDTETRARIFEPFFTTKEVGKGTGLGLATVYGIIKQSNGQIEVESEPGKGATFRVSLPRVENEGVAPRKTTMTESHKRGTGTILLAEDEPLLRELGQTILTQAGYEILTAPNAEALKSFVAEHTGKIDLLLTDVVMPGMSGPELVHLVRARWPNIRVLYMSGYADDEIEDLDRDAGFLQKPFTPAELTAKIAEMIGG
ncbi:MAG: hybrid sensor histidine kinase/response regulator [Acidobacteria bacterium]|nr:MAG: hybrid sensor histidine kinase/response regulator [Acidobacteriota bacterium]PYV75432.1 MAG: hybrid sensor histidine kinase/response regulator [Acidobacteriota bacterium]